MLTKDQIDMWDELEPPNLREMEAQMERDTFMFNEYQQKTEKLMITTGNTRLIENTLGLIGEAGEVAEYVKKYMRDGTTIDKKKMSKELGDVLFYVSALAGWLDEDLSEVAHENIDKLTDRKERGVLGGSGDSR